MESLTALLCSISFCALFSQARYLQAKLSVHDRSLKVATVIESLEMEMELLCLTGVEDQLQADVRPTLEILRNAGIKVGAVIG